MAKKTTGERFRSIPELRAEMEAIAGARSSSGRLQDNYTKNYWTPGFERSKPTSYTAEQYFSAQARWDAERSGILGYNSDGRRSDDVGRRVDPVANSRVRLTRGQMQTRVDLWYEMEQENHLRAYGDDPSARTSQLDYGESRSTDSDDWGEPEKSHDRAPAPITVAPTSTINPERPRTVAAGYVIRGDDYVGTLTVVFRDGTYYNYYEIPEYMWEEFKSSPSKGRYIASHLDSKPRGIADLAAMDIKVRSLITIYQASRIAQKWEYRKGTAARRTADVESGRIQNRPPNYKPHVPTNNTRRTSRKYLGNRK